MTAATHSTAAAATLQTLHAWADAGWLRPLDSQLAAFVLRQDAQATPQLLMATAMGFGSALTAGQSVRSAVLHRFFDLRASEQAVCFVNIGTAQSHGSTRVRPAVADYVHALGEGDAA